jgi:dynein heavy chain, axonemal
LHSCCIFPIAVIQHSLSLSRAGGGKSWDQTLQDLSKDILAKVPPPFDVEKALLDFPVRYEESMNTVLTQELIRFNNLNVTITKSLKELQRAIKVSSPLYRAL